MKKFTTPIAIEGSKEELELLIPKLEELGYEVSQYKIFYIKGDFLVTNYVHKIGYYGYTSPDSNFSKQRIKVFASNPDLALALAAMTTDPKGCKGEWYVYRGEANDPFTCGKLYQLIENNLEAGFAFIDNNLMCNGFSGSNYIKFRKATVEEIQNHFNKQNMEKKTLGYKVKEGVDEQAAFKAIDYIIPENRLLEDTVIIEHTKQLGVLDLLFTPVYEEEKKIITVPYDGGVLEVEISKRGIGQCLNKCFTKADLHNLINNPIKVGVDSWLGFSVFPTQFNIGYNGQYKGIKREDIQRVIDAL